MRRNRVCDAETVKDEGVNTAAAKPQQPLPRLLSLQGLDTLRFAPPREDEFFLKKERSGGRDKERGPGRQQHPWRQSLDDGVKLMEIKACSINRISRATIDIDRQTDREGHGWWLDCRT